MVRNTVRSVDALRSAAPRPPSTSNLRSAWIVEFTRCARRLTCHTFESSAKGRHMKRPTPADSSRARHLSTYEGMEGSGLGAADGARNRASAPNQF